VPPSDARRLEEMIAPTLEELATRPNWPPPIGPQPRLLAHAHGVSFAVPLQEMAQAACPLQSHGAPQPAPPRICVPERLKVRLGARAARRLGLPPSRFRAAEGNRRPKRAFSAAPRVLLLKCGFAERSYENVCAHLRLRSGLLLSGCSSETPAPAEKKAEAKPAVPFTGRQALQQMYIAARGWAADIQPVQLVSILLPELKADSGKAAAWQVTFVSASLGKARSYTYSSIESRATFTRECFAGSNRAGPAPPRSPNPS